MVLLALVVLLLTRRTHAPEPETGPPADIVLSAPAGVEVQSAGFRLSSPATIAVDAIGRHAEGAGRRWIWESLSVEISEPEDPEASMVVTAWILDAATRAPVWRMSAADVRPVPDSLSLRQAGASLSLPAGDYEVYLASILPAHSGPAGDDPVSGLLARLGTVGDPDRNEDMARCRVAVRLPAGSPPVLTRFDPSGELPGALLSMTRTGDGVLRSAGFTLRQPGRLRIRALVEHAPSWPIAADTAWIVDARTRARVWDASSIEGVPAGGHAKNRLVDTEIALPAGAYIVTYATDASHSWPEFNAAPPHDPQAWGIALAPAAGFDSAAFTEQPGLLDRGTPLFEATRLGNDVHRQARFTLRRDGALLLRAVGEAVVDPDGEAADGASISAGDGTRIWRLQRDNTERAGGSSKNRLFDGVVELKRGTYTLKIWTDDTHAFDAWNAPRPWAPETWGVTLWPGPGLDRRDFVLEEESAPAAGQGQARPEAGTPSESSPSGPTPSGQAFSERTR